VCASPVVTPSTSSRYDACLLPLGRPAARRMHEFTKVAMRRRNTGWQQLVSAEGRCGMSARTLARARASVNVVVKAETAKVDFEIECETQFGDSLKICGDSEPLGGWQLEQAVNMTWSEGHKWTLSLTFPVWQTQNFKCVVIKPNGQATWQPGKNKTLVLPDYESAASEVVELKASLGTWTTDGLVVQVVGRKQQKPPVAAEMPKPVVNAKPVAKIAVVDNKKDKKEEKIDQKEDQKAAEVKITDFKAKEAPDERPLIDRIAAALEVFETDAVVKVTPQLPAPEVPTPQLPIPTQKMPKTPMPPPLLVGGTMKLTRESKVPKSSPQEDSNKGTILALISALSLVAILAGSGVLLPLLNGPSVL